MNFYSIYKLFNNDLKNLNNKQLLYHFEKFGKNEKRIYSIESFYECYPNYNINNYKRNNKNLNFQNDYEYMVHYHLYGKYDNLNNSGLFLKKECSKSTELGENKEQMISVENEEQIILNQDYLKSINLANYYDDKSLVDLFEVTKKHILLNKKNILIYISSLYYNEYSEDYYFKALSLINYNDYIIIVITNDKLFIKELLWLQYIDYVLFTYNEIQNDLNYCKINNLLNINLNIENKKIYTQIFNDYKIIDSSIVSIKLENNQHIYLSEDNYNLLLLSDYIIFDYIYKYPNLENSDSTKEQVITQYKINIKNIIQIDNKILIENYENNIFISEYKIYIYKNKILYKFIDINSIDNKELFKNNLFIDYNIFYTNYYFINKYFNDIFEIKYEELNFYFGINNIVQINDSTNIENNNKNLEILFDLYKNISNEEEIIQYSKEWVQKDECIISDNINFFSKKIINNLYKSLNNHSEKILNKFINNINNIDYNLFNKIETYVINLDKRIDRLEQFKIECNKINLEKYQRFPGVIPTQEQIKCCTYINPLKLWKKNNIAYLQASLGCKMSHLEILKKYANSSLEYIMILEDDIIFENNILVYLNLTLIDLITNNIDWDILYLSINLKKKDDAIKISESLLKINKGLTTTGQIFKVKNIEKIIKLIEKSEVEIDNTYELLENKYCVYPMCCYQRNSYSDINNTIINYGKFHQKFIY